VDGLEEPSLAEEIEDGSRLDASPFSWENFPDIPPVLVARNDALVRSLNDLSTAYPATEADQSTCQVQKGFVQIRPAFVADREPTIRRKPGKRPLDHPPVPPQPSARILAPPGDAYSDTALVQSPPAMQEVVAFVRVQLLWTFAGPASA
jgi:hypothetical protein